MCKCLPIAEKIDESIKKTEPDQRVSSLDIATGLDIWRKAVLDDLKKSSDKKKSSTFKRCTKRRNFSGEILQNATESS